MFSSWILDFRSFLRTYLFLIPEEVEVIVLLFRVAVQALGSRREVEETVSFRVGSMKRSYAVAHFTLDALELLAGLFAPVSRLSFVTGDVARQTVRISFGVLYGEGSEGCPVGRF
jgi:hypothetical protein